MHLDGGEIGAEAQAEIGRFLHGLEHGIDARAIGGREAARMIRAEERPGPLRTRHQGFQPVIDEIAARQRAARGPWPRARKEMRKLRHDVFGKPPVGRDLAAIDREQRRFAGALVEAQHIFAAQILRTNVSGFSCAIIIERAHAGIRPHHIGGADRGAEIFVHHAAQVIDFRAGRQHGCGIADEGLVGGADQREIVLERDGEYHAAVGGLQDIGAVVIVETAHHDMTALVEAQMRLLLQPQHVLGQRLDPGAGGIDQHPRRHLFAPAARFEDEPPGVAAFGAHGAGPRANGGAAFGGVDRVEDDEAGIVGEAVGVFEGVMEAAPQRRAGRVGQKIELAGAGQNFAPADPVVDQEAEAQQQRRPPRLVDRQHEAQRPDQVRRRAQQHLALLQRGAHQAEFVVLEIAQAAMDQLR